MERQFHGFDFEKRIIEEKGLTPSKGYTSKWDAFNGNTPVSIKCEKFGTDVEMADYFRNAAVDTDFEMYVGFWDETSGDVVEVHHLLIPADYWHSLFSEEFSEKFHSLLDNITNDHADDARWKAEISALKKEWKAKTPNVIRPRFKRDHKTQKRIQCAINNSDFYNIFVRRFSVGNN